MDDNQVNIRCGWGNCYAGNKAGVLDRVTLYRRDSVRATRSALHLEKLTPVATWRTEREG